MTGEAGNTCEDGARVHQGLAVAPAVASCQLSGGRIPSPEELEGDPNGLGAISDPAEHPEIGPNEETGQTARLETARLEVS